MKYYAPVAPLPLLKEMTEIGVLGSHVMLLAHDVLENPNGYSEWSDRLRGVHIILDNSAAELPKPLAPSELLRAASYVQADTLCLPDVLGDKVETIERTSEFLKLATKSPAGLPHRLMMIPQGNSDESVLTCAGELRAALDIYHLGHRGCWGIPRWIGNKLGSRATVISNIVKYLTEPWRTPIHLLGMSKNTDDDIACCRMQGVSGIDSANPLVLGQQHINMFQALSEQHPDRETSNYWAESKLTMESVWNIVKLRSVIAHEDLGGT